MNSQRREILETAMMKPFVAASTQQLERTKFTLAIAAHTNNAIYSRAKIAKTKS